MVLSHKKNKNPNRFGDYEFYDPALDLSQEFVEVVEDDDGDGQDDGKTVNIQEQKVLTYDTNTKLFSEVNTNELQVGPTNSCIYMVQLHLLVNRYVKI